MIQGDGSFGMLRKRGEAGISGFVFLFPPPRFGFITHFGVFHRCFCFHGFCKKAIINGRSDRISESWQQQCNGGVEVEDYVDLYSIFV